MKLADLTIEVPEGKCMHLTVKDKQPVFLDGPFVIEIHTTGEDFLTHDGGLVSYPTLAPES